MMRTTIKESTKKPSHSVVVGFQAVLVLVGVRGAAVSSSRLYSPDTVRSKRTYTMAEPLSWTQTICPAASSFEACCYYRQHYYRFSSGTDIQRVALPTWAGSSFYYSTTLLEPRQAARKKAVGAIVFSCANTLIE
jgi:hypothetical protein